MNNVIIEKAASQKGAEPEKKKICGSAFILAFIFVGALLAFNKR
jgi:hypothetical protein